VAHSRWVTNSRPENWDWGLEISSAILVNQVVIMWHTKMSHPYWELHWLGDLEISGVILVNQVG
jgi:hypothetical protein